MNVTTPLPSVGTSRSSPSVSPVKTSRIGAKLSCSADTPNNMSALLGAVQRYQTEPAPGPGSSGSWFEPRVVPGTELAPPSIGCASAKSSFGGVLDHVSVNGTGFALSTAIE